MREHWEHSKSGVPAGVPDVIDLPVSTYIHRKHWEQWEHPFQIVPYAYLSFSLSSKPSNILKMSVPAEHGGFDHPSPAA